MTLEEDSDEYEIPIFNFYNTNTKNSEKLAEIIRDKIGMNSAHMHSHKKEEGLNYWIKKIEELGILIFQFYNINPKVMRGYALHYDKLPIIGINHQEHFNGKKFTLFHELAHIITKKEGISNFNTYNLTNKDEIFCNAIAAETLVPTHILKHKIKSMEHNGDWNDTYIKSLEKFFNVSPEVIIRRLFSLKKVSKEYYKEKKVNGITISHIVQIQLLKLTVRIKIQINLWERKRKKIRPKIQKKQL